MSSLFLACFLFASSILRLSTFLGETGSYAHSLCLLVVCGDATHVVFLHALQLFGLILITVSADILR